MLTLFFYVVAAVALGSAIVAMTHSSPVVNVLSLVVTFFCVATCYALLGASFLAAAQILVYAGAILVLFLFVIMLLNVPEPEHRDDRPAQRVLALVSVGVLAVCGLAIPSAVRLLAPAPPVSGDVNAIGRLLLSRYALPFELITVVLLAAMVGAMVLVKRKH
jgi:NADH-quinone oxidoreductase subunit J